MSLAGLAVTGMWGEPVGRAAALDVIDRAVELGIDVLEVPFPFGPAADLVGTARLPAVVFVAVRLTAAVRDPVALRRIGRDPDLILASRAVLDQMSGPDQAGGAWPGPIGQVIANGPPPIDLDLLQLAAVRGPWPAPVGLIDRCEQAGIPYLAPSIAVLGAGARTIALPAPRTATEVERVLRDAAATPPASEPG